MHSSTDPAEQTVGILNTPESLFSQCINFVAENLDLVENFCGFPSQIGEKIFMVAMTARQFEDERHMTQFVNLFVDAFGKELLFGMNVSGQYLGLNYYLEQILLFKDIVELNVSHCGLGDDHEILPHVAQLRSLEVMDLSYNCLSDKGLRLMTTPYRMFRRGPDNLRILLFSGNQELTPICLVYLSQFPRLYTVNVTGCKNLKLGIIGSWEVHISDRFPAYDIQTRGWASVLVDRWMKNATTKSKQAKQKHSFFYTRSSVKEAAINNRNFLNSPTNSETTKEVIIATRTKNDEKTDAVDSIVTQSINNTDSNFQSRTSITETGICSRVKAFGMRNKSSRNKLYFDKQLESMAFDSSDIMSIYKIDGQPIGQNGKTGFIDILKRDDEYNIEEKTSVNKNKLSSTVGRKMFMPFKRNSTVLESKSSNLINTQSLHIKGNNGNSLTLNEKTKEAKTSRCKIFGSSTCRTNNNSALSVKHKSMPACNLITGDRNSHSDSKVFSNSFPGESTTLPDANNVNNNKDSKPVDSTHKNSSSISNPRKRKRIVIVKQAKSHTETKDSDNPKLKLQKLETKENEMEGSSVNYTRGLTSTTSKDVKHSLLNSLDMYN